MKNQVVEKREHSMIISKGSIFSMKKSNFLRKPSGKCREIILTEKEMKRILGKRISIKKILNKKDIDYPLYIYGVINQANMMKRATAPCYIGKLHSLIKELQPKSLSEWKRKYNKIYPDAVKEAKEKIFEYLYSIHIPKKVVKDEYAYYVEAFLENLIFNQTYSGLKIQEIIMTEVSRLSRKSFKWSSAKEDSKG
jgi:hypothetical protein